MYKIKKAATLQLTASFTYEKKFIYAFFRYLLLIFYDHALCVMLILYDHLV